jgi:hypothetical protein
MSDEYKLTASFVSMSRTAYDALRAELATITNERDAYIKVVSSLNSTIDRFTIQLATVKAERDALREANRWIPVGERLPENEIRTLALGPWFDGEAYYQNGEWLDWVDDVSCDITHWRPLPEPPQDGQAVEGGDL